LTPGLYLVATPIGNLGDVTLRALSVILRAGRVYCEDTRHSRKLLSAYGIGRKLLSYHEHNAGEARPAILSALAAGESIALISDAGTPLLADPGYKLALAAIEQGARVFPIPGPSAVISALIASGLPTDSFHFGGFLPPKQGARRTRLETVKDVPGTLIFFETANRLQASLADVADVLGDRPGALLRELTKRHEQLVRGRVSTLWEQLREDERRGEMVLLLAEAVKEETATSDLVLLLREEMVTSTLKDAVAAVAARTGVPRKVIYDTALRMRDRDDA
jgi:16S rRNA (cytidine1402-2'-O)-methyltransferase